MRVVVVTEQLRRRVPGGIGTYVRGLLGGLAAMADGEPSVIAPYTSRLPGPVATRLWDRSLGRNVVGDVVHAPSLAIPPTTAPLTVFVHDLAWREMPEAYPARGRQWHEAALVRAVERADALLVPSERTAELLAPDVADRAVTIDVVPEGCDHLPPPDDAGAAALLDRLGVNGPFLLTVGTIQPRKNLERLLAAYALARPKLPEPWPLVVVGATGWGATLRPVDGAVLAGAPDDAVLAALYRRARLLAYVPLAEGFGLPPIEAMHAGVPVVASPLPSTGTAAFDVDPVDTDAIGTALLTVATDDSTRTDLVRRGTDHAATMTWADAARRHMAIWRRVRR